MTAGNGKGRIHLLDHQPPKKPLADAKGRPLHRAPDLETVYQLIAEETAKVHEYYLNQIPQFVATMIRDGMMEFGLVKIVEIDGKPMVVNATTGLPAAAPTDGPSAAATTDAPGSSIEAVAPPDGGPADAPVNSVEPEAPPAA